MQELGYRRRSSNRRRANRRAKWLRGLMLLGAAGLLVAAVSLFVDYQRQAGEIARVQQALQAEVESAMQPTPAPRYPVPSVQPQVAVAGAQQTAQPAAATPVPMPTPGAAMMPHLTKVFSRNNDLVGWLKADGFEAIDYPIVQRDNWFYVEHDFYGRKNVAGNVFLDEVNSILPQDDNLILHGHNMKNGSMFGKLARLLNRDEIARSPFFNFSTLYLSQVYVPYAVTLTSIDPANPRYFNFLLPQFSSTEQAQGYTGWLQQMSQLHLPVDVQPDDQLLTLVTCHGKEDSERLIVGLRALRPGEDQRQVAQAFLQDTRSNK